MGNEIKFVPMVAAIIAGIVYLIWLKESTDLLNGKLQMRVLADLDLSRIIDEPPREFWHMVRSLRLSPFALERALNFLEAQGWVTQFASGRYRITAQGSRVYELANPHLDDSPSHIF